MINSRLLTAWAPLVGCVVFDVLGIFIIKMHINAQGPVPFAPFTALVGYFFALASRPMVILGLVMFFTAPVLFAIALSRMEISTAYPVQIGLNFALLIILAVTFLDESLSWQKVLGLICIAISLWCLAERTTKPGGAQGDRIAANEE